MITCNMEVSHRPEYHLWKEKQSRLQYLSACLENYYATPMIATISPEETMLDEWYMDVGCSTVDVIIKALLCSWVHRVNRVLDIPCGHGRILRHIVNLFPEAEVHACDIDLNGVDFCSETFHVKGIYSKEDLTSVTFNDLYDLIWVGSLFTHTSRTITKKWMKHLTKFLSPKGIMVATIHGRWCENVGESIQYINPKSWRKILDDYHSEGYGYQDYEQAENHDYLSGSYGIALTKMSEILKDVETIDGVRVYSYQERGWADHQDVLVIGKPSYNLKWD